ncbi:hypothetical protein [Natronococcus pandeyae]|uniref:hypothetical protein n=1 Tax=Natronococcus pandeyae TaxID=2055836 RepID=UPI001652D9E6|nr:hypothetical protein [Natronococcus pandeyae]
MTSDETLGSSWQYVQSGIDSVSENVESRSDRERIDFSERSRGNDDRRWATLAVA